MDGIFITFEGGEGVGKSTQIALLEQRLTRLGVDVLVTREPGGTDHAEALRDIILSGAAEAGGANYEAMLFAAARLDHLERKIIPALENGKIVLCDRFADSTRVYQGSNPSVSAELLDGLEALTKDLAWPDLTLVLDLDPADGMQRAEERRDGVADRFEKEDLEIQQERRQAFLKITNGEPKRCKLIDGAGDASAVHERIWAVVEKSFGKQLANWGEQS